MYSIVYMCIVYVQCTMIHPLVCAHCIINELALVLFLVCFDIMENRERDGLLSSCTSSVQIMRNFKPANFVIIPHYYFNQPGKEKKASKCFLGMIELAARRYRKTLGALRAIFSSKISKEALCCIYICLSKPFHSERHVLVVLCWERIVLLFKSLGQHSV